MFPSLFCLYYFCFSTRAVKCDKREIKVCLSAVGSVRLACCSASRSWMRTRLGDLASAQKNQFFVYVQIKHQGTINECEKLQTHHKQVYFSFLFPAHEQWERREPAGDSGLSGHTEERSDQCCETGSSLLLGRQRDGFSSGVYKYDEQTAVWTLFRLFQTVFFSVSESRKPSFWSRCCIRNEIWLQSRKWHWEFSGTNKHFTFQRTKESCWCQGKVTFTVFMYDLWWLTLWSLKSFSVVFFI